MADAKRNNGKLIQVRPSGISGTGVYAARRIRKGRRIIEYVGERISPDEELKRYPENGKKHHHTFLFGVDKRTTIDAGVGGNDARFINHSCEPNCEAVQEDDRIFIEAIKNIQPGVELTYDYNFEVEEEITPKLREFYRCECGSPKCRGTILKYKRRRRNGNGNANGNGSR
jgi:hypothetical protein